MTVPSPGPSPVPAALLRLVDPPTEPADGLDVAAITFVDDPDTARRLALLDGQTGARLARIAPKNTRRARSVAWRCWQSYLREACMPPDGISPGLLVVFAEWMHTVKGLSANTMRNYLSCVIPQARALAGPDGLARVPVGIGGDALTAIAFLEKTADYASQRSGRGKSPAITPRQIRTVCSTVDTCTRIGLRDKALLLLWICLGARGAEIAHLLIADLQLQVSDEASGLQVVMPSTKTGPRAPFVPYDDLNPEICAVRAWLAWLDAVRAGPHGPAAFPQMTKGGTVKPAAMSPDAVRERLQVLFQRAGVPQAGGHGVRRGHIQSGLRAGLDPDDIRRHVGLAAGSTAFYAYVEEWNAVRGSSAAGIMGR